MRIHYAHLVMLDRAEDRSARADARAIREALDAISLDEIRQVAYDGTYEDLFFYLERLIVAACGEDAAGRLHTARSRNDIDMTMYRMQQRRADPRGDRRRRSRCGSALIPLAERHREPSSPRTRTPSRRSRRTIAHYLLAVIEQLERDTVRLQAAYASTNQNPLGACAITGTGFPIDRDRTTELLGFDGADRQHLRQHRDRRLPARERAARRPSCSSASAACVQDLLLWCTIEFGYLRLADGFVQGSSIMPQKRNPVALEHARAIGSKALGQAAAIVLAVHNTPFGDIVDTEDDLQPLVAQMFKDAAARCGSSPRRWRPRAVRRAQAGGARRAGLDYGHRARRHAGARSRPAVQGGPRDRGEVRGRMRAPSVRVALGRAARGLGRGARPRHRVRRTGTRGIAQCAAFRRVRTTPGGRPLRRRAAPSPRRVVCLRRTASGASGREPGSSLLMKLADRRFYD